MFPQKMFFYTESQYSGSVIDLDPDPVLLFSSGAFKMILLLCFFFLLLTTGIFTLVYKDKIIACWWKDPDP
jgi:hypothetical protein